jgi:hypothetical protein
VARVLDGDSLTLDTGQRVRLAKVEAPVAGDGDQRNEPAAAVARTIIERGRIDTRSAQPMFRASRRGQVKVT